MVQPWDVFVVLAVYLTVIVMGAAMFVIGVIALIDEALLRRKQLILRNQRDNK